MSPAAHNVTFSPTPITLDDNAYASGSSSPAPLIPASSSPSRLADIAPLRAAKTVLSSTARRAVIFSPRNDTKYFHSDDSILPSPTRSAPPPSIRAYAHSDPVTPFDTPSASRGKTAQLTVTPTLVRSILKARAEQIRLAASVEEGTLNNKEAARLLVSGKRPRLLARDSFQLAMMQKAAGDGLGELGDRKGKGRMADEVPGSDDSTASVDSVPGQELQHIASDSSTEEEEEVELDGALATRSLINIILDGAEDLLTLEEAYNTLVARLRDRIPTDPEQTASPPTSVLDDIRICTQPIRDEAPAMVRALQRDLQRLLGKLPSSEITSSDAVSSPFRDLMPLRDSTPISETRSRFTPSPTPNPPGSNSSPFKNSRQGYTESEVRYRREAAGVGAAVLRFLAFTFCSPHLSSCFTEADLQSLLEQVMIIPRTPKLPTPNTKRTYYLSVFALAQINIPASCVQPVKEKIVRALESALTDSLGTMGGLSSGKEGPSATKKEGFHAVAHLVSNYPSIFFPYYSELLPSCLRGLTSGNSLIRYKSGAAISAFARARFIMIADAQTQATRLSDAASRDAWNKAKVVVQKSEFFVVSHYKGALKVPGKNSPIYGKDGEKKMEWHSLDQALKDAVGSTTDVHWACAVWAAVVTLMGSAYGSSGLAAGFNHIMERSLAPSTNLYRPLLARIAWAHAIHAYVSAGYASSINEDGHLIRSYKPFAASSQLTIEERTRKIQMAFQVALPQAADPSFFARALSTNKADGTQHYVWQRSEKAKKLQWLMTSCLGATAVIYAYSGMALCHEDQPAKEMATISGLPSSDGIPMPDLAPEESRLPRLDNAWEKVVHPILKSYFAICGVDRLTVHGWAILEAITAPRTDAQTSWSLDRLLSPRYLSGEIFTTKDKDTDLSDLLEDLEASSLQPLDIPAWGHFWVAKRLGRLFALFDEALASVNGVNHATVTWVENEHGVQLIPVPISNIWTNLLQALGSVHLPNAPPTPLFLAGLQAVTRQIVQTFNRDPKTYMPITWIDEKGQSTSDEDTVRIGVAAHLFKIAVEVLGSETLGTLRLPALVTDQTSSASQPAFGSDAGGNATVAGHVLGQILRTKAASLPLQSLAQSSLKDLISNVLDVACAPGFAGKLLGDITNAMPWIFEDSEETQLDVWRLIAIKWTQVIDIQPSSAAATSTNHTGALLVSLLSGPFRGREVTSFWHQHASQADLEIWQALLKVTVLRFRAKRVGSNLGVLESLAGHLVDFLEQGDKTSSSTITLSCLAAATSWISFVPSEHYHTSHYSINENYVPVDFLTLINDALLESYPSFPVTPDGETQEATQTGIPISPAVGDLFERLGTVIAAIPSEFILPVIQPLKAGLTMWLQDEQRVVVDELAQCLDDLYIILLSAIGTAIEAGHLSNTSETMNTLVDIYAPRLARAQSSAVPVAFQAFWQRTFGIAEDLVYSDDVAGFLRDVLAAVPGIITTPGLSGESQLSEDESQAKYPHTQSLRPAQSSEPQPESQALDEAMELDPPLATGSYDADISQDPTQAVEPVHEAILAPGSPRVSEAGSERYASDAASMEKSISANEDVFGPAAMTRAKSKSKGKKKGGRKSKGKGKAKANQAEEAQSLPELTSARVIIADTATSASLPELKNEPIVVDSDDDSDCIIVQPSPGYYRRRGMVPPSPLPSAADQIHESKPDISLAGMDVIDVDEAPLPLSQLPIDIEEEEEEEEETIEEPSPTPTPTPSPKPVALPSPSPRKEIPVSSSTERRNVQPRSSLLHFSSKWLSRVPSLTSIPFFSPGPPSPVTSQSESQEKPVSPPASQFQTQVERSAQGRKGGKRANKRKAKDAEIDMDTETETDDVPDAAAPGILRRASTESVASVTSVTSGKGNKRKLVAVVDVPTTRASKRRKSKGRSRSASAQSYSQSSSSREASFEPALAEADDDDEDELLLSPESARRRTREEEEAIRGAQLMSLVEKQAERSRSRSQSQSKSQSQSQTQSGRFDDAPNDPSPTKTPSKRSTRNARMLASASAAAPATAGAAAGAGAGPGPSPLRRTTQQTRVLEMLDEAARTKNVIDNLDYAGVKSLLRNLNELREAAEGRMMSRLEELRGDKKN